MTFPATCDLFDRFGEDTRVLPPSFRDFGLRPKFMGAVVTVKCLKDNSRIKEVLATPGAGKVLVVDGGASTRCALLGDTIAKGAATNARPMRPKPPKIPGFADVYCTRSTIFPAL